MARRFGRYETLRTIASGGMATVYLGRAVGEGGFERLVAIKVMHPHIADDPDFRAMFLDEARLAARIRHPNVVGTIDVQTSDEGIFIVMDFVDGPSLHSLRRELRREKRTIPIPHVLRIFIDTLTGLHAAHELIGSDGERLNLVHRDVSPQNVLVGNDGVTRITDFGVARAEARITSTRGGQLKGKLAYMPPEQVRNEPIDRRVDIYAAGVALWEAFTGRRLFQADNEAGLLHMILDGATTAPSERNPDVPAALDRVCMTALAIDREQRYPTAAAFADALEDAAEEAGIAISSTRRLAAFVQQLPARVSERPAPLTTTPSSVPLTSPPASAPPARVVSTLSQPNTASAVVAAPALSMSVRRKAWMAAGAALVLALGLGLAWSSLQGHGDPAPAASPQVEVAPPPSTAAPSAEASAPPSVTTSRADAEPSGAPNAAASSSASAVSARPHPRVRPAPRTTPKPPPSHVGPGYRPTEL